MESAEIAGQLRSEALQVISSAVDQATTSGVPHLVIINVVRPADAGPLLRSLARGSGAHLATATDPSMSGQVLEHLDLGGEISTDTIIAVDRAHMADATSLSHLHRLLVDSDAGLTIVLAHDPEDELGAMAIDNLATTSGRPSVRVTLSPLDRAGLRDLITGPGADGFIDVLIDHGVDDRRIVARLTAGIEQGMLTADGPRLTVAPGADGTSITAELTPTEVSVGQVLVTAGVPVHATAIAAVVGSSADDVLAAGDGLVRAGLATDGPKGYGPTDTLGSAIELTSARRAHIAGALVDNLESADAVTIGKLLDQADRPGEAFERLHSAALERSSSGNGAEAFWLAAEALTLTDRISPSPPRGQLGALHVIRGRHLRNAGWSQKALDEALAAIPLLEGVDRVDAMSLAATLSDDLQLPQQAERHLAMAELAAHQLDEDANIAPLLALHARTLSRLGFPSEADAALAKATALLPLDDDQRYAADTHLAWIELDRGEARMAERSFASLVDRAAERGEAARAAQLVYWGRALFMTGEADKALDAIGRAETLARSSGATAVLFLASLARAEGTSAFERWDDYLAESERLLDLVLHHLPQWENIARYHRARAMSETGATSTAQLEIHRAIDTCPPGADGWRWRRRCEAARMVIDKAAGQGWDKAEAENLTDELLVSRWFGTAVELMTARATIEDDEELAAHAATLADEIGNPVLTIQAVHAADAWDQPASARVADKARSTLARLPEEWRTAWETLPQVEAALSRTSEATDDTPEFREALASAWAGLGLSEGDSPLSPAQRQATGLVRRAPARLGRRLAAVLVGAAAVVALSVGVTFALGGFSDPETVVVEVTVPRATTTRPFVVEENVVAVPEDGLAGSSPFRGSDDHAGVVDASGVAELGGIYWVRPAGDVIRSSPVAFGNWVYFGSNDHFLYAVDQTTGSVAWRMETGAPIVSTPAIGNADTGEGNQTLLVVGSDDGKVWAHDALNSSGRSTVVLDIGEPVTTSPIITRVVPESGERLDLIVVAGGDGYVHAVRASDNTIEWKYPADEPGAAFTGSPTAADGVIYVGDDEGLLHLINAITGEAICTFPTGSAIRTAPAISDGDVFVGAGVNLYQIPQGSCPSRTEVRLHLLGVQLDDEVAVEGGFVYYADGPRLTKMKVPEGTIEWAFPGLGNAGPPTVANGVIYVGSQDGWVVAVSSEGEELWRFDTGGPVTSSVAVGSDVVYVTSESGRLFAIAPRP